MVEKFIKKHLERDATSFAILDEIYKVYLSFCKKHDALPLTKRKLNIQLRKYGQGVKDYRSINGMGHTIRYGVKLK